MNNTSHITANHTVTSQCTVHFTSNKS